LPDLVDVPDVLVAEGLHLDPGAILGYPPARSAPGELVLGEAARIRSNTIVYLGSRIGARFETGHNVIIREQCRIGDDVSIWSNTVVDYGVSIGNHVKIHSNCYIAQFTEIQDGAFLAPGVTIANDLYPGQAASAARMSGPVIGAGAQIGVNVTILPFVRIGAGCLIGAGAVVARDIPDGSVAFGNPATVRGKVAQLRSIESRVDAVSDSVSRYRMASATESVPPAAALTSR
jgi:acetyltransferase-like isoleucine patch superfamily enzyme